MKVCVGGGEAEEAVNVGLCPFVSGLAAGDTPRTTRALGTGPLLMARGTNSGY